MSYASTSNVFFSDSLYYIAIYYIMIVLYEIGYCSVFQFHFKAAVDVFKPQLSLSSKCTEIEMTVGV